MHKTTHLRVAKIIKKVVEENLAVKLDTYSFMYGSIKPDLSYRLIQIPHFKHKSYDFIKSEINSLMKYRIKKNTICTKEFSERLGIIIHYLSDFFCEVHKESFKGSFITHYIYELRLATYFRKRHKALGSFNYLRYLNVFTEHQNICNFIDKLYDKYSRRNPSYAVDITYIMKVCISVVVSILTACMAERIEIAA